MKPLTLAATTTIITLAATTNMAATVLVTHGMGTSGIAFYQESPYITTMASAAKELGHPLKSIAWLSPNDPNGDYAGIHPQERIAGAVAIAKAIIDERAKGNEVVLVGHSFGGQVMQCATRLVNPGNKELSDTVFYEIVYAIKDLLNKNECRMVRYANPVRPECERSECIEGPGFALTTNGIQLKDPSFFRTHPTRSPAQIINTLIAGWKLSKVVIAAIEKANIINQHLIDYVKQHVSLSYIDEVKNTWKTAFNEVQSYKTKFKVPHANAVSMLYTIGTPFNGSDLFTADMTVVTNHVNLYSTDDTITELMGTPCAPKHPRTVNLRVFFEPTKEYAPSHHEFCGNLLMAPWLLAIPTTLKGKGVGNWSSFVWGKTGMVTFFTQQMLTYKMD